MEVKAIEGNTFEMMKERFDEFTQRIKKLCGERKEDEQWMDNQDVCQLLQISKRTLQSYRDKGILAYSQTGHKCFYRVSDVEKLLTSLRQKAFEDKKLTTKNYSNE
ncbi:Helix-turn-helix domain protein [Bacteroidales bacterium Barb6XT]|nr:Helix-turn-helix domain protein [Bacteroidales bacterium Barb6XT]